jgi:hypothetical protein
MEAELIEQVVASQQRGGAISLISIKQIPVAQPDGRGRKALWRS